MSVEDFDVDDGLVARLYADAYFHRPEDGPDDVPESPLLYVPLHVRQHMNRDMEKAEISKWTPQGKLDFHACRATFVTWLDQLGASAKEMRVLARHGGFDLTLDRYVREFEDRLRRLVEDIGERVRVKTGHGNCDLCVTWEEELGQKVVGMDEPEMPQNALRQASE